jgi:hypothetical protein
LTDIGDTLRQFNRKERHFLIQNCLGDGAKRLSRPFCDLVSQTLGSRLRGAIFENAWWGTDFHFDWLVGALIWHFEDDSARGKIRINTDKLITGSQQDLDLIIASGSDLIFIEAKGLTGWSSDQIADKLIRLTSLGANDAGVIVGHGSDSDVRLHFILASVRGAPQKLDCTDWPTWAKNGTSPYHLHLDAPKNFIWVGRTDKTGAEWFMHRSG